MANTDRPFGFRPIRNPAGNAAPIEQFSAITTTNIFDGEIMYLTDSGEVQGYTGTTTGRLAILGAAAHPLASATTDRSLMIYIDPAQEYEVQVDDNSLTAITDFLGANFAGTNLTSGNATLLRSSGEIDGSSATTTNNSTTVSPFKALRYSRGIGEDASSSFVRIVVKINHENLVFGAGDPGVL